MARRTRGGPQAGLGRTVKLISALLNGERLDARKAAKLLDVQIAAATKQLKALEELPGVSQQRTGGRKVWSYASSPATWGTPSVVAACFGSSLAPLFKGTAYQHSLSEVRARIIGGTKRPDRFKNIERKFWFHSQGGELAINDSSPLLDEIVDALLDEQMLKITYVDSLSKESTAQIGPLAIVLYQHQLYLLARRPDGTTHPFRLSRIREAEATEAFEYPERDQFDPETIFRQSFGVWLDAGEPVEISVRLSGVWATYAEKHRWHPSQRVLRDSDGVVVTLTCKVCREVEQWILGFGEHAEVIAPPTLRARLLERIQCLSARYSLPAVRTASDASD